MKREVESTCFSGVVIILMLVTLTCAIVNWPSPTPTVDIVYGPEIETAPNTEMVSTPVTPEILITIANITTFDYWRETDYPDGNHLIQSEINTPLLSVTEIRVGFSFSITDAAMNITAAIADWNYTWGHFITNSSTLGIGIHSLTLKFRWSDSDSTYHRCVDQIPVQFSIANYTENSVQLNRFWLQVAVSENLCKLTVDIRRTNGESIYASPFMYQIYIHPYAPQVHLIYNDRHIVFMPTRENDTLLIPLGNLTAIFKWPDREILAQNITAKTNQSIFLRFNARFVCLDVVCSQRLPQLEFKLAFYFGGVEYKGILAYSSPFFYTPSNNTLYLDVRSCDFGDGILSSTLYVRTNLPSFNAGSNRNVTLIVHPNWIQIGSVLIPLGKLISLLSFALIFLTSMFYYRFRIIKSRLFIPWFLLVSSFFIPWLSSFYTWTYLKPLTTMNSITTWTGNPTFGSIVSTRESNTILMAQSSEYFTISILLWMVVFLVFSITIGQLDGFESKFREQAAGLGIVVCCCIEFLYLADIFQVYNYNAMILEMGPFLSIAAVIYWLVHPRIMHLRSIAKPEIESIKTTRN